jgi:hypothetical protein
MAERLGDPEPCLLEIFLPLFQRLCEIFGHIPSPHLIIPRTPGTRGSCHFDRREKSIRSLTFVRDDSSPDLTRVQYKCPDSPVCWILSRYYQ